MFWFCYFGGGGDAQMRNLSLSPFLKALQLAGLLFPSYPNADVVR